MKNSNYFYSAILLLFSSCTSNLVTGIKEQRESDYILTEIRTELADLRQQSSHHKVEMQILEEKLEKLQAAKKSDGGAKSNDLSRVEKKVSELEHLLEKAKEDLREIASHANQTTSTIAQYREKILECERQIALQSSALDEISKLKGTLKSLSKAMQETPSVKVHKVKAGDSLERIAKQTGSSIEALRKVNGLTNDRIIIDQELKIPNEK